MPPRRSADEIAQAPGFVEALAKAVSQGYREGYAAAEKAFADACAASRGANDQANLTLTTIGEALAQAYEQIRGLQTKNHELLKLLDGLGVTYAQRELIASKERIETLAIEREKEWKSEAIRQFGPGIKPLFDVIANKIGGSVLKGDGTKAGEQRAACVRCAMAIASDPDLEARLRAKVGDADWNLVVDFFMSQANVSQPAASPPAN